MTQLSLVSAKKFTTPKQAVDQYVAHLAALTLVVDYSVHPPALFFTNTKKPASFDMIPDRFAAWAAKNNVRIEDYAKFMETLAVQVKQRLPHVYGMAFKPVDEPFFEIAPGIPVANTFVPFLSPAVAPPPPPPELAEYFERLFPSDADRQHVLQFIGHSFQHPLVRPTHALLITGTQRNGKSTLEAVLKRAMGSEQAEKHVYSSNSYSTAFKQFSAVLCDSLFCVFDDATAIHSTHNKLKLQVTRRTQTIEVKNQRHLEERSVYARIIVLNNSRTPMEMDNCHRFYATEFATHVSKHNPDGVKANTDAFFDRFFAWLESPDAPAQLQQFFRSVDLTGFNPYSIPQTPTLLEMIDAGRGAANKLIEGFIADLPVFHMNQLVMHLKANHAFPTIDVVGAILTGLGYACKRRLVEGCGEKQIDIWVPPPPPGKKKTRSPTEAEAEAIKHACAF
jgi:hypothetical protein